ncbi:hypothetical protein TGDOM2_399570, partial [Toxoplasma gondii GAB2-2007-GAL-DOM2]
ASARELASSPVSLSLCLSMPNASGNGCSHELSKCLAIRDSDSSVSKIVSNENWFPDQWSFRYHSQKSVPLSSKYHDPDWMHRKLLPRPRRYG